MNCRQVVATTIGTLWLALVLVAWLWAGIAIESDAYWLTMWLPAMFTAASPFFVAAIVIEEIK